eukprot:SAG11_NODE_2246_length_3639_cov_1.957062_4_plen_325_part_00
MGSYDRLYNTCTSALPTEPLLRALVVCSSNSADPCSGVDCGEHGSCDGGTCQCEVGYSGENCEVADPCAGVDCGEHGQCVAGTCECEQGYSGESCGVLDPCAEVECGGHGRCDGGTCTCESGYSGGACEVSNLPPTSCGQFYESEGFVAGLYMIQPAQTSFQVYCTVDGYTKVLQADYLRDYEGSEARGTPSAFGVFKLSDEQINDIILAQPGVGMRFQCGQYFWDVPNWVGSGIVTSTSETSIDPAQPWQMRPDEGSQWYEGYRIGEGFADADSGPIGVLTTTRPSNNYDTSGEARAEGHSNGMPACRVGDVGEFSESIWVMT